MDEPKPEEKKEEEKKPPSALEQFEQAFAEATTVPAEPPKDDIPPEPKDDQTPPTDEPPPEEAAAEPKEPIEPPAEPPKVEAAKEQVREPEPIPKAPEPELREEPPEPPRQPEKVDYSIIFRGLENDITDDKEKEEYVNFLKDSEELGRFAQTTNELVGKRLINYVNESFKVLVDRLTPYLEATRKSIEQSHATSIMAKHPDYQNVKGDVLTWIKEQPKYLQKSLMAVYNDGEPEDVTDMLDRYKKDRGLLEKKPEEPAQPQPDPEKEKAKAKIKEKIDNLSVVKTKDRPVSAQGARPLAEDFDQAFDEAVATKRK